MKILYEGIEGTRAYCELCKYHTLIRAGDRREYSRVFKRDTLQPHENLYYKIYPRKMNVL